MNLLDKVALVTGGAKRIGREIALSLANEGCDIVIHYNTSHTEADALAREMNLPDRGVAMALGTQMVQRNQWAETTLKEDDSVIIIKAACGG